MSEFRLLDTALQPELYRESLALEDCGGYASFEGWVRNHNDGRQVLRLEYEAYAPLVASEGARIVAEAHERFAIGAALGVHREGVLEIGDCAVWVGASAAHRDAAFAACRYIIDQAKLRLPIWKKEHYVDGTSGWVNCEQCAGAAEHAHE